MLGFDRFDNQFMVRRPVAVSLSVSLSNREQFVELNDTASKTLHIVTGVPQGSILGPSTIFNPFRLLYGYIRTKMVTRCDFRTDISVHGLCDRNMGLLLASKRHFTVSPHEVFT